jgi:hypothetical protein
MNVLLAPNSHSILTSSRLAIRPTGTARNPLGNLRISAGRIFSDSLAVRYGLQNRARCGASSPLLVVRTDALELSQCDPERWPHFLDDLTRRGFVHNPRVRTRIACRLCPGGRRVGTKQGHPSLDPRHQDYAPIGIIVHLFLICRDLSLLDTELGLIIIYTAMNVSLVIWLMTTYFQSYRLKSSRRPVWRARTDGRIYQLGLPLVVPVSTALLCIILAWNEFLFALVHSSVNTVTVWVFWPAAGFVDRQLS